VPVRKISKGGSVANLFALDSDRHETALSHWRRVRPGGITDEEADAHEALLARNLAASEDTTEQNYIGRAVFTNGTDTEHVRSLLCRRWARKGLRVIEGGKGREDEPLSAA
jgi:hypothetical protein